jgi:hypothetical protein
LLGATYFSILVINGSYGGATSRTCNDMPEKALARETRQGVIGKPRLMTKLFGQCVIDEQRLEFALDK